jgi:soluble lytic murein transglycosylase-like protein
MEPKRAADDSWTPPRDFREICACQRHARRQRALWRRALRVARKRGVALLVTVPLAFGAIGMEAMNVSLPALARQAMAMSRDERLLTASYRQSFSNAAAPALTLDLAKEEFFRTEVPFGAIIYSEALKNDLAPELIAAVVESESDFRPHLVSNKSARGLMQIIPETGRLMGCDDPFDPHANVAAGTKYLRYLINRFGDEQMALAAYNAGEGKVERLGGIPQYPETLDYVSRVASRTRIYRQRIQSRYLAAAHMQASVMAQ